MTQHHHFFSFLLIIFAFQCHNALNSVWRWECQKGFCQKKPINESDPDSALSLAACRLFCSKDAALWPKPTGNVTVGNFLVKINRNSVDVLGVQSETPTTELFRGAIKIFKDRIINSVNKQGRTTTGGKSLVVTLKIKDVNRKQLTLDTDESYALTISETSDGRIETNIDASTYFGGRNALETLGQLIIYDDLRDEIQIPRNVFISDKPAYPHRGILLDTARNYINVEAIKRTLDGMGASKLNTFHWHITDSHSFPYVSQSKPELSKYGAYTPSKIYSPADVASIVEYGLQRGVKVIPEFDAPAHVGEGWQNTSFVVCFNAKPWGDYCVEPPCGQFDPTQDGLYDYIEAIYGDMLTQFQPDIFHMGGDEVNFGCWRSVPRITEWMKAQGWGDTDADYIKLWDYFQTKSLERLYKKAGKEIPVVLWTSTLTESAKVKDHLPVDKYIIQIWTTWNDTQIKKILDEGYKVILSNYDALYLDCGFGGWVQDGNNWCSPYIGWQKVYGNTPAKIAGDKKGQVLGAEATLWAEQVDSTAVDTRLWPRAAALAEVLWSEPTTTWRDAESRILVHRERLVALGVNSDALEPEWCQQNEENCPVDGVWNRAPAPEKNGSSSVNKELASISSMSAIGIIIINWYLLAFFQLCP